MIPLAYKEEKYYEKKNIVIFAKINFIIIKMTKDTKNIIK